MYLCNVLFHLVSLTAAFTIGGIVNTTSGLVRGTASTLRPDVSSYLGIRYAKSPTGLLRFAAPVSVDRGDGIIDASSFVREASNIRESCDCPCNRVPQQQAYLLGPVGEKLSKTLAQDNHTLDEDCLTINIWTKPQSGERHKAVLFYIHGGAFWLGSGSIAATDGSILADENDVVVVSFNYRLSIFGFSGAPGEPWNVGLMDQRLALEWTRKNIAGFGGDPSRITVFGQSVGGVAADMLAFSYSNDPIAHAFIAMSGVASSYLSAAMQGKYPRNMWYKVSGLLKCGGGKSGVATVPCMRSKSRDDVLAAIRPLGKQSPLAPFWPVPDGKLVPEDFRIAGDTGRFARVPFLAGSAERESGLFFLIPLMYSQLTEEQVAALPLRLIRPLGDILTLIAFTCPTAESVGFRRKYEVPVWRYRYYGGSYLNTRLGPAGSCWHASDVFVLFGTASSITGVPDSEHQSKAAAYMRKAWATFAKDPYNGLSTRLRWPQFDHTTLSQAQLSLNQQTEASFILGRQTDGLCSVIGPFKDIYLDILKIISWLKGPRGNLETMPTLTGMLERPLESEERLRRALEAIKSLASSI
ncbi:cholinesterase [Aspergillus avenaceus]|uniref:Cholinesterase n=1 Tax=Aspergillus avenaceus TaxID=36643 RepID=A0A5N6TQS2_ASPAV|nr:cholinesterase [Aspergillus avenaceus]